MTDKWTCYKAIVQNKATQAEETVHVYGMQERYARSKLVAEYPRKSWKVLSFQFLFVADLLDGLAE